MKASFPYVIRHPKLSLGAPRYLLPIVIGCLLGCTDSTSGASPSSGKTVKGGAPLVPKHQQFIELSSAHTIVAGGGLELPILLTQRENFYEATPIHLDGLGAEEHLAASIAEWQDNESEAPYYWVQDPSGNWAFSIHEPSQSEDLEFALKPVPVETQPTHAVSVLQTWDQSGIVALGSRSGVTLLLLDSDGQVTEETPMPMVASTTNQSPDLTTPWLLTDSPTRIIFQVEGA